MSIVKMHTASADSFVSDTIGVSVSVSAFSVFSVSRYTVFSRLL